MNLTLSRKEAPQQNYSDEDEWKGNIDTVMRWLTEEGLDLVTLYFGEPDFTGHIYGPESQQVKDMVMQVDRTVGYLRDSIRRSGLEDSLNLIITSDHGMSTINKQAPVELHRFPNFTFEDIEFELLDGETNGMLLPKEGMLDKVYEVLKDAHPRLHVYKKESFPKSLHYAGNPRIMPLLMYSDLGYVIHGVSCLPEAGLGWAPSLGGWSLSISVESTPWCSLVPSWRGVGHQRDTPITMQSECMHRARGYKRVRSVCIWALYMPCVRVCVHTCTHVCIRVG